MPDLTTSQPHGPAGGPSRSQPRLAVAAARTAEDNRGREIVVLDLRQLTCIFDYFVIATGTSRRQLHAMSEEIDHRLEDELGDQRMGIEGYAESRWILLDYGSVVFTCSTTRLASSLPLRICGPRPRKSSGSRCRSATGPQMNSACMHASRINGVSTRPWSRWSTIRPRRWR